MKLKNIELIACDIDGVLVKDTFSPVLHRSIEHFGGVYTSEVERNVFSRPRKEVGEYLRRSLNLDDTKTKAFGEFFWGTRREYMKTLETTLMDGVEDFLEFISSYHVKLVCYGGLAEEDIVEEFKEHLRYFDRYVCTNDFRPGIKEIVQDIYGLAFDRVLFIDDVNTVAEVAKVNNVPFIGIPPDYPYGFQRADMMKTKVKYILNSVAEIDEDLLKTIDDEAGLGTIWKEEAIAK